MPHVAAKQTLGHCNLHYEIGGYIFPFVTHISATSGIFVLETSGFLICVSIVMTDIRLDL